MAGAGWVGLGMLLSAALMASPAFPETAEDARAAGEPILKQLEAFRLGDFDAAYTFASEEIKRMFDRQGFERMVKGGYPEIARSTYALITQTQVAPNGNVYVSLRVRGANGVSVEALYEMVWEGGRWRINGVVTKPDAGSI